MIIHGGLNIETGQMYKLNNKIYRIETNCTDEGMFETYQYLDKKRPLRLYDVYNDQDVHESKDYLKGVMMPLSPEDWLDLLNLSLNNDIKLKRPTILKAMAKTYSQDFEPNTLFGPIYSIEHPHKYGYCYAINTQTQQYNEFYKDDSYNDSFIPRDSIPFALLELIVQSCKHEQIVQMFMEDSFKEAEVPMMVKNIVHDIEVGIVQDHVRKLEDAIAEIMQNHEALNIVLKEINVPTLPALKTYDDIEDFISGLSNYRFFFVAQMTKEIELFRTKSNKLMIKSIIAKYQH